MASLTHSGGVMVCSYTDGSVTHTVRFDILPFDADTFAYIGSPYKTTTEISLADTFAAFAERWRVYYSSAWTLTIDSVWQRVGESSSMLPSIPDAEGVLGTAIAGVVPRPTLRRIWGLTSQMGRYQSLWLTDVADNKIQAAVPVTATSGGFDNRDRDMQAYLSGTDTAIVVWDGYPVMPSSMVRIHFAVEAGGGGTGVTTSTSGVGSTGNVIVDCLTFPLLATICNTTSDEVVISTPDGSFTLDNDGLDLPNSSRIQGGLTTSIFPSLFGPPGVTVVDDPDNIHQPPDGDYSLVYTLVTDDFESLRSAVNHVTWTFGGSPGEGAVFHAFDPSMAGDPLPAPYTAVKWYLVAWPITFPPTGVGVPGGGGLFHTSTIIEEVDITVPDGIHFPPTIDSSRTPDMELLGDGSSIDVRLPFKTLTESPTTLLGKDPDTNLPAYCPLPNIVGQTTPITVPIPPGEGVDTHQQLCGAAFAMSDFLSREYNKTAGWVQALESSILSAAIGVILTALSELLLTGEAISAFMLDKSLVKTAISTITSTYLGSDFPQLSDDENQILFRTCYCALQATLGNIKVTDAIITNWSDRIAIEVAGFSGAPKVWLIQQVMKFFNVSAYQTQVVGSTPSTACEGFSC